MAMSVRARVAISIILSFTAVASASGAPVTESDAVRLFLEQSPQAQRVPLIEQSAGADLRRDALLSNPVVAYEREEAAGVRDEFLTLQQELPISGRRGLMRESAAAAASAAGLAATRDLLTTVSSVRALFYEVLYRESVSDRLRQAAERMRRIVDILAAREREGEGAGYDLLRAEQELAEIEIAGSEAQAALAVARARFGGFFDPESNMTGVVLRGDLQPAGVLPEPGEAVERALLQRGDLKALHAEAHRRELDRRVARRRRFPEPTLTAGWKRSESLGLDDTGFVAAVTVPLPVFDRGQVAAAHANAGRQRIALEVEILEREIRADVAAALARERAARDAAQRQGQDVERRAGELRKIAELAYDEGEAGILELLDAYRTSLVTELRVLGVRYEAKRAGIDLDRAIGVGVKP